MCRVDKRLRSQAIVGRLHAESPIKNKVLFPIRFPSPGFAGHTHERTQTDSQADIQTDRQSVRQADRHSRIYKANMTESRTDERTY